MSDKSFSIGISRAPDDPDEKKAWVNQMLRIQFAMYVDDKATCEHCGHTYTSVDDMLRANPKRGHAKNMSFVCGTCYTEYAKTHPLPKEVSKRQNDEAVN